ncbi:hypothetical protein Scep_016039 [Stephania cephalantha]|uniref:Uncharacterized protein n=1 Tax=Stephania cephalantha TaxID=152367 RepID=A0AAP0INK1_9MAGN
MNFIISALLFLLINGVKADYSVCDLVDCGRGTCRPSNAASIFPFECDCFPGWKPIKLGPMTFPSCVLPNCTLDMNCGGSAPPSPSPPFPPFPTLPNFTDTCAMTWCGDGTCVANGTWHLCKCNEGSGNLMNMTAMPCFKQCSLGADCNGIILGPLSPPSPSSALQPPNPSAPSPPNNGPRGQVPSSSITHEALVILSLAAVAFSSLWIYN